MGVNSDSKLIRFRAGIELKRLYDKCPKCGCDLENFYESVRDESDTGNIQKDPSGRRPPAFIDYRMRRNAKFSLLYRLIHWVINPLSNTKNYTAKPDDERLSDRVIWKKVRAIKQDDKSTNNK